GLAVRRGDRAVAATHPDGRAPAACRRWPLIHGRRGVLHGRLAHALRALHLAPLRARGDVVPLLRGAGVRDVAPDIAPDARGSPHHGRTTSRPRSDLSSRT